MKSEPVSFAPSPYPFFQPVISTVLEVPEGQTLYVCYCFRGTLSNETSHVGCGGSSKKLFAFSGIESYTGILCRTIDTI